MKIFEGKVYTKQNQVRSFMKISFFKYEFVY